MIPAIGAGDVIPEYVPDEVVISVPRSAPTTLESNIAGSHNLTILERQDSALNGERLVRMRTLPGAPIPDTVARLERDPRVTAAQPNYLYHKPKETTSSATNDLQYALTKVGAANAHTIANGSGVIIAVIDSGVDRAHPDLTGAVSKAFDAIGDENPEPDNHGTAVAGIIGGRGLVRGVAPAANLVDIRAFKAGTADGPRLATSFILLRGMDWALGEHARVLNLSFAGPRDPVLGKAVAVASTRGAIMVAAAGNDGPDAAPAYPAAYAEVIAVTATDPSDHIYEKANRGSYITLSAPGVEILAPNTGRAHNMHSGTSFAAAHVSGIIALMLERAPDLTAGEVVAHLVNGARDLGPPGRDDQFGAGGASADTVLQRLTRRATKKP